MYNFDDIEMNSIKPDYIEFKKPGCKPEGPKPPHPHFPVNHWPHKHDCKPVINPYNKVCFANKHDAILLLSNKDLHAGEVAFAYYYDNNNALGLNAILAVGNIKVGAPNIIFDNAEDINEYLDKLSVKSGELVSDIDKIKCDINNIFSKLEDINESNDKIDSIDEILADTLEDLSDISKSIDALLGTDIKLADNISNIENSINGINDNIANILSSFTEIIDETSQNISDTLNSSINTWIEKHNNDTIIEHNIIRDEFKSALSDISTRFSITTGNLDTIIASTKNELNNIVAEEVDKLNNTLFDISVNIKNMLDESNNIINAEVEKTVKDSTDMLNNMITNLKQEVGNLSLKAEGVTTNIKDSVSDVSIYLTNLLEDYTDKTDKEFKKITDTFNECYQYVNTTSNNIKTELTGYVNTKISEVHNEYDTLINLFNIELSTLKSAIDARFNTIEGMIKTLINDVKDKYESAIRSMKSQLITEYTEDKANQNRLNELTYIKKGEITLITPAYKGGIKQTDGGLALDIDINGILHINGMEFKLERNY